MANFIAIDLDSQGLYAVAGALRGGVKVTHALAWTGDDENPPSALTADTAKELGEALRDRLRAAGFQPAPVLVTVGRDRVILKELKYPPVAPTEEPALVRFQAMKEMSESPEEVVLDYAPLGEVGGQKRSMAVAMRREQFHAIQTMCQAAGLKLAGVSPRPYAVAACLGRAFATGAVPPPADKTDAVVALTLGPAGGEFTVVRGGEVTFTLALPAPVIANENMLIAQVRRNLAVYAGQNPGRPIEGVYLAEVEGRWADRLGAALGVPVHAFDPLAGAARAVDEQFRGRFAGAVGLLAGQAADALPINFAQPRQPQTQRDPAKRRLTMAALAGGILAFALLVVGYVYAEGGQTEVNALIAKRDGLKQQLEGGGPDAKRLAAVDAWSKREVNWLDELYELSDRMPKEDTVHVTTLKGTQILPGKDGKQDAHANLELKLAATSTNAGNQLLTAFRDGAGASRYYTGTTITHGGGLRSNAGKHNTAVIIKTRVIHREPEFYEQNTKFPAVKKLTGGAAGLASTLPPARDTEMALAPQPKVVERTP